MWDGFPFRYTLETCSEEACYLCLCWSWTLTLREKKREVILVSHLRLEKTHHCFVLLEPLWHYFLEVRPILDILIKFPGMNEFEHFSQHNGSAKLLIAGKLCLC